MPRFTTARLGFVASAFSVSIGLVSAAAMGAPAIQQVSGTFSHKASVTISGSGFGTKPTAAPVVWDDASGSDMLAKWDNAWPSTGNSAYYTRYRTPQRGVAPPHNRVGKYIAGAHGGGTGADGGYNVMFWKGFPKSAYVYTSWYEITDPAWVFGGDENYKTWVYSVGSTTSGYPQGGDIILNYGPPTMRPPGDATYPFPFWVFSSNWVMNPDVNGHSAWWAISNRNPVVSWGKMEVAVKVSSGTDGYVKQWENGRLVVNYLGPTDTWAGTTRQSAIGGYARMYNQPNNWRYFTDAYVDNTLARVVLANNANLANATIIDNQIPTAWASGSIAVSVNLGKFIEGQTAYLFVVDDSGAVNSSGYPVTVGSAEAKPSSPTGIVVQ